MQKIQYFSTLVLFLATVLFTSCDDNSNSNNSPNQTLTPGNWKVVYFFDKQDETSNYAGYVFDFSSNGTLSASTSGQTYNGTWSTGFDDSKNKFLMTFSPGVPSALLELQEDWLILKMDSNVMQFEHTSGGNGDTDVLHFESV
jgi:hypothetical protein